MRVTAPTLTSYVAELPPDGSFSVWAGTIEGTPVVTVGADDPHYAASMMKLPVVLAAYRQADEGMLDLDREVLIHNDFASAEGRRRFSMSRAEDSDPLTWQRLGTGAALRWLANRAIVVSGNLATNVLLEHVGLSAVEETLTAVGTTQTVVARGIEDYPARDAGLHNLVTAADLALILARLAAHDAASPDACEEVLAVLAAQQVNDSIPPGLPPGTKVAHKTGWVEGVAHDAGIVYPADAAPYILSVCTTSSLSEQQARDVIAQVAAASWSDRQELR